MKEDSVIIDDLIDKKLCEYLRSPTGLSWEEEGIANKAFEAGFCACLKEFEDRGVSLSDAEFKNIDIIVKDFNTHKGDYPDFASYFNQHLMYYGQVFGPNMICKLIDRLEIMYKFKTELSW